MPSAYPPARVTGPEHVAIAARDRINDIPGAREAGRLHAGDLDVAHPYVSPLNGELRGVAPMIVFSGTRDLSCPDSIDLAAKARAAGLPIALHLRRDQPHNYAGCRRQKADKRVRSSCALLAGTAAGVLR
jgi:epsilon-lactone hydrolase